MAGDLQSRIDFSLNYSVEGQDDLQAAAEGLEAVEERSARVMRAQERMNQRRMDEYEAVQRVKDQAEEYASSQRALQANVEQTNEAVRNSIFEFEMYRLEFEQGNITNEEYREGIGSLLSNIESLEVQTLSSVRTLRQLSNAQREAVSGVDSLDRSAISSSTSFASFSRILSDLPNGMRNFATSIPAAARNLNTLSIRAGGVSGALRGMIGFITGPAGAVLAISTLLPLLVAAARNLGIFESSAMDTEEATRRYTSALDDLIDKYIELQGIDTGSIFSREDLDAEMEFFNRVLAENEESLRRLREDRAEFLDRASLGRVSAEEVDQYTRNLEEIEARESAVENINERILRIKNEILSRSILESDETTSQVAAEQARLDAIEESSRQARALQDQLLEQARKEQAEREQILAIQQMINEEIRQSLFGTASTTDHLAEQVRLARERRDLELQMQALLERPPAYDRFDPDESRDIENALIMQDLAEQARLASIRDSVSQEEYIRLNMQSQFEAERLELIRRGITDEEALKNLSILQQQELDDALLEHQQSTQDRRLAMFQQTAQSLQGIGDAVFSGSEENARKAFELNKAIAMANALAFAPQAIIRAYAESGIAGAISASIMTAAQIAKIAATRFRGRGMGSQMVDRPDIQYRGIQAETSEGVAHSPTVVNNNFPDTIRLEDSAGNFLTQLEWARDREGGAPYTVERRV